MGGCSEVEGHPPGLEAHQEDPDIGVMGELVNHAVPVVHGHAALQPHTLHSSLHHNSLAEKVVLLGWVDGQMNKQKDKRMDGQTCRQATGESPALAERTPGQTDRHADRQQPEASPALDRQTHRQTYR